MKTITVEGDHYAVGRNIGILSKRIFADYIKPSENFQRLLPWRDNGWLAQVDEITKSRLPAVYRELQGLADGCEQSFNDMLLWNCRGDLLPTGPEGCTSILANRENDILLAHNEDGDPNLRDDCFILDAKLTNGTRFVCFAYPASIPGHTLGANSHGLAYTVNNIRLYDNSPGLPRMLSARALLEAKSTDDFITLLNQEKRVGGFHFMVADCINKNPQTVEAPLQGVSAQSISDLGVHANHLVHSKFSHIEQHITQSSHARQERMEVLSQMSRLDVQEQDFLRILGDQENTDLPIYRTDTDDPDGENTLATVMFRLTSEGIDVAIRLSPISALSYCTFLARTA